MQFKIKMMRILIRSIGGWGIILYGITVLACARYNAIPSIEARTNQATTLAKTVGWQPYTLHTADFIFKGYGPVPMPANTLTIYIEGDGLAWLSADTPSDNPTPLHPLGLQLAIRDKQHSHVVYLARACQFVTGADWGTCRTDYWTNGRFSPVIVDATQHAVTALKLRYHAHKIILIGYSGGGAIATLLAARRTDVARLITIAGPLDTEAWVRYNNLTPLHGSLNPADAWQSLTDISQTHWVGGRDTVVPAEVAFAYANHFPITKKPEIKIVPTYDHTCCWATKWQP